MKKINIIIIGILLVGIVAAAGIGLSDRDIYLGKEDKSTLANIGIANIELSNITCDDRRCFVTANDEGLRDRQYFVPRYYQICEEEILIIEGELVPDCVVQEYTINEIQTMLDAQITKDLKQIAEHKRYIQAVTDKGTGGTITIKEKK